MGYSLTSERGSVTVCLNSTNALIEALKQISVFCAVVITFKGSSLGDVEAQTIAEFLKENTNTFVLYLNKNSIGDEGAKALADSLMVNKTLKVLDLTWNMIGNDGAVALADALKTNNTLKTLLLGQNNIGSRGANALATALLRNKTLSSLYLDANGITNDGLVAVVKALRDNFSLCRKLELGAWQVVAWPPCVKFTGHYLSTMAESLLNRNRKWKRKNVDESMYCLFVGLHCALGDDVYLNLEIVDRLPYFCKLDRTRKVALLQSFVDEIRARS